MVFDESESQGWCTECAYFLANSEPRGAYSAGAYKKKRVVEMLSHGPDMKAMVETEITNCFQMIQIYQATQ